MFVPGSVSPMASDPQTCMTCFVSVAAEHAHSTMPQSPTPLPLLLVNNNSTFNYNKMCMLHPKEYTNVENNKCNLLLHRHLRWKAENCVCNNMGQNVNMGQDVFCEFFNAFISRERE
jgi:hypothetical protein